VTDADAPSTFGFEIFLPGVFLSGPTIVSLTVSGTLTDGGSDGVSITPTEPDRDGDLIPELAAGFVGIGFPATTFLLEAGPASSTAGAYGPFSVGPIAGPDGSSFDTIGMALFFTLSGGGDIASLTATLTIDEGSIVPWMPGLWLVAGGIGILALARRRLV
jgi:hypothetical protein